MENKIPEKMLGMKLPGGAKVQAGRSGCAASGTGTGAPEDEGCEPLRK